MNSKSRGYRDDGGISAVGTKAKKRDPAVGPAITCVFGSNKLWRKNFSSRASPGPCFQALYGLKATPR
jgi:hypothetical protein